MDDSGSEKWKHRKLYTFLWLAYFKPRILIKVMAIILEYLVVRNRRKDKINSITHTKTFNIWYILYTYLSQGWPRGSLYDSYYTKM